MKATGIVRRVDDLGRIVIPKEIRRTLRIREGGLLLKTLIEDDRYLWAMKRFHTISNLNYLSLNWKAPPFGVADYVIFDLENHIIPSHIDLHIKNFKAAP